MSEAKLKRISNNGIAQAIAKAELYRYLAEPEEAESICRDILAVEGDNQVALRMLGLAISDQLSGGRLDRWSEAESVFQSLTDLYERFYYTGLLHERRVKAQLRAGQPLRTLVPLIENAMLCFEQAEKIRPPNNDEALLRWNRCVRLLQSLRRAEHEEEVPAFETVDSAPAA
jgi:tetratricopeptide (TPR) repeat protein